MSKLTSKDYRELQEAYKSIYDKKEEEVLGEEIIYNTENTLIEDFDTDILLENIKNYLVFSNYVDTEKQAYNIMPYMSEEFFRNVIGEMLIFELFDEYAISEGYDITNCSLEEVNNIFEEYEKQFLNEAIPLAAPIGWSAISPYVLPAAAAGLGAVGTYLNRRAIGNTLNQVKDYIMPAQRKSPPPSQPSQPAKPKTTFGQTKPLTPEQQKKVDAEKAKIDAREAAAAAKRQAAQAKRQAAQPQQPQPQPQPQPPQQPQQPTPPPKGSTPKQQAPSQQSRQPGWPSIGLRSKARSLAQALTPGPKVKTLVKYGVPVLATPPLTAALGASAMRLGQGKASGLQRASGYTQGALGDILRYGGSGLKKIGSEEGQDVYNLGTYLKKAGEDTQRKVDAMRAREEEEQKRRQQQQRQQQPSRPEDPWRGL